MKLDQKKYLIFLKLVIVLLILILGIIQWQFGFAKNKPMVGETDSFVRLSMINGYIKDGRNIFLPFVKLPMGGVWLSGYFSFFILLGKFGLQETGFRIITWLCGLFLVLLVWVINSKLTKKNNIFQILILLAFAVSPLMLQINFEMLSEPVAVFLLLLSLYFLLNAKNIWSVFFLFLSQSVRYESWFIVPLYWVYFLNFSKDIGWKKKLGLCFGTLLFPLIWIITNFVRTGDFLSFYTIRQSYLDPSFISKYGNILIALNEWTLGLQKYIGHEWMMLWIFGMILVFFKGQKKQRWWAWISFYFFIMTVVQLWLKSTEWLAPRYIYFVYVLSVPLVLVTADFLIGIFSKAKIMGKIFLLILFGWIINQYVQDISVIKKNIDEPFIANREVGEVTNDLKNNILLTENDKDIYLWLISRSWLINDFTYYFADRKNGNNVIVIENSDNLLNIKSGSFVIAERDLIKEGQGFTKKYSSDSYEVWSKNQ